MSEYTDYTAAAGTLTFAAGVTTQSIHLNALPNALHQPTKTFHVTIANPSPAGVVIGPRSTTAVSILNHNPVPNDGAVSTIDDFEGTVPFSNGDPGIFTFSGDAASTPTLTQVAADDRPRAPAGNHALRVAYTVGSYGGFVHDLASPQDWSSYDGFSFWVKGTGSGQTVEFEVKDGGPDAENGELWQSFFKDDTNGWKNVEVPFAKLKKRTDYQPAYLHHAPPVGEEELAYRETPPDRLLPPTAVREAWATQTRLVAADWQARRRDLQQMRQRMRDIPLSLTGDRTVFTVPDGSEVVLTGVSNSDLRAAYLEPRTGLVPEMRLATGLARNTTAAATSSAVPMRPVGFMASTSLNSSGMLCSALCQKPPSK